MDMLYEVTQSPQKWLSIEPDGYSCIVYRIPYSSVKEGKNCPAISNKFIVYILQGISYDSRDYIYVGKSTSGLDTRPGSHEDKCKNWTYCYILTRPDAKVFNDAIIQYLEDSIRHRVDECSNRFDNKTEKTNSNTANATDIARSEKYLEYAYACLSVLGLDLTLNKTTCSITDFDNEHSVGKSTSTHHSEPTPSVTSKIMGEFHVNSTSVHAKAIIREDSSVEVLAGSEVGDAKEKFNNHNYSKLRNQLIKNGVIKDGKFVENYTFNSLSAAAAVILGRASNGKREWLNDKNVPYADLV